jgi:hypothetical protein
MSFSAHILFLRFSLLAVYTRRTVVSFFHSGVFDLAVMEGVCFVLDLGVIYFLCILWCGRKETQAYALKVLMGARWFGFDTWSAFFLGSD